MSVHVSFNVAWTLIFNASILYHVIFMECIIIQPFNKTISKLWRNLKVAIFALWLQNIYT